MVRVLVALLFACLAALPEGVQAGTEPAERNAALCERAILGGASRGGVPTEILHAISLTETGRNLGGRMRPWPWAINREGEGYWFASRDEALAFAKASLEAGRRSFDVGCFQINYHWHGHNFASLEAMFDQDVAADYAAQFLNSLHGELGTWSAAAGAYHSRTPEYASRYRARFDRMLAGLGGGPLEVAALEPAPPAAAEAPQLPRKSRTRMTGGPRIITLGDAPEPGPDTRIAAAEIVRVERGKLPRTVTAALTAPWPVLSSRNAPF